MCVFYLTCACLCLMCESFNWCVRVLFCFDVCLLFEVCVFMFDVGKFYLICACLCSMCGSFTWSGFLSSRLQFLQHTMYLWERERLCTSPPCPPALWLPPSPSEVSSPPTPDDNDYVLVQWSFCWPVILDCFCQFAKFVQFWFIRYLFRSCHKIWNMVGCRRYEDGKKRKNKQMLEKTSKTQKRFKRRPI